MFTVRTSNCFNTKRIKSNSPTAFIYPLSKFYITLASRNFQFLWQMSKLIYIIKLRSAYIKRVSLQPAVEKEKIFSDSHFLSEIQRKMKCCSSRYAELPAIALLLLIQFFKWNPRKMNLQSNWIKLKNDWWWWWLVYSCL